MDGNGRWARNRALPRVEGHLAGIQFAPDAVAGDRVEAKPVATTDLTAAIVAAINAPRPKADTEEKERPSAFASFDYAGGYRHTPSDFQSDVVVRIHARRIDGSPHPYGKQERKILTVDWVTRQFTVHPSAAELARGQKANRGLFISFEDVEITDHIEPLDLSDPVVALMEKRRELAILEAQVKEQEIEMELQRRQDEIVKAKAEQRQTAFSGGLK